MFLFIVSAYGGSTPYVPGYMGCVFVECEGQLHVKLQPNTKYQCKLGKLDTVAFFQPFICAEGINTTNEMFISD